MARFTVQRYCAKNDRNGNPRRVFVVRKLVSYEMDPGQYDYWSEVVMTVDEGYGETLRKVRARFPWGRIYDLGDVDVSPGVYRRMVNYLK